MTPEEIEAQAEREFPDDEISREARYLELMKEWGFLADDDLVGPHVEDGPNGGHVRDSL